MSVSKTWQIVQDTDDGDTNYHDHTYCAFSIGIYLGRYTDRAAMVAFVRFVGVDIPKDSIIEAAKLSFLTQPAPDNDRNNCNVDIQGDNEGNCATYINCADLWARPRTVASIPWDVIEPWEVSDPTAWHDTVDISPIIQEIINRPDWASGNAIGIFLDGHRSDVRAQRYVIPYSKNPAGAAKLTIQWAQPLARLPTITGFLAPLAVGIILTAYSLSSRS